MIELSEHTEALVRRLAEEQSMTVDAALRRVLETEEQALPKARDTSPAAIAARKAALDRAVREIAALPDLDPRSSQEIMDGLDPL